MLVVVDSDEEESTFQVVTFKLRFRDRQVEPSPAQLSLFLGFFVDYCALKKPGRKPYTGKLRVLVYTATLYPTLELVSTLHVTVV